MSRTARWGRKSSEKSEMVRDSRGKMIGLSHALVEMPSIRTLAAYLLVVAFVGGFLVRFLHSGNLFESVFFGGGEGFWWLFLPAVLTAGLASSMLKKRFFPYSLAASLAAMLVVATMYVIGAAIFRSFNVGLYSAVLVANALALVVWFMVCRTVLSLKTAKALALSVVHPIFNLGFLVAWNGFGLVEAGLPVDVSTFTLVKFVLSAGILLLALASLLYILNAPSKRNFGVTTTDALALFFAQWIHGEKGLEDFLGGFGQTVQTWLGAVVFKRKNGSLKAAFLVPSIHYGPFGNLGSSRLPAVLSDHFKKELHAEAFVFHGLVNHDMNLVHSAQGENVAHEFERLVKSASNFSASGFLDSKAVGENQVAALGFGRNAMLCITRAPYSTEDFDLATGLALRNLAYRQFDDALVVDRHNALTNGEMYDVGSDVYNRYVDAVAALRPHTGQPLSLGVWSNPMNDFSINDGIGAMGLKVAIIGYGKATACVVLVDGNNAQPAFRETVCKRLQGYGFDFVDFFTSDSHSVNSIGGVHNPVGARVDQAKLLDAIEAAVVNALDDLEPVSAALVSKRVSVAVMGIQRQAELLSTINAIVSVAKVAAPLVFLVSLGLVLLALKWVGG
ncbi:DUF2070 family protein [Candidatus Micrarchaeota archaeon]|nr:DUF2070 family protein [Candidatus Micrarchaeota archaeon]